MALPYSHTWTGTNGDAWSGDWATGGASGTTLTIQSNTGRILTGSLGGYADFGRALLADQGAADFDLTVDLLPGVNEEKYPAISFRTDRAWHAGNSPCFPANGYAIELGVSGTPAFGFWSVERVDASTRTGLSGHVGYTLTSGDVVHVNVLCDGADVEIRIWSNAASKPGTATYSFTDSSHASRTGHHLALQGGNGTVDDVYFDNLAIDPLSATVTGVADTALTFAAPAVGTRTVSGVAATALTFTAPAVGTVEHPGVAATALTFDAPAQGTRTVSGTAATDLAFTAPAVGTVTRSGTAVTDLAFSAPAVGTVEHPGVASTDLVFSAPAVGTVEGQTVTGVAETALVFTAPAVGTRTVFGTAGTVLELTASAAGVVDRPGVAATVLTFAAPAAGTRTVFGAAGAVFVFAAPAVVAADVVTYAKATSGRRPDHTTSSRRKATV